MLNYVTNLSKRVLHLDEQKPVIENNLRFIKSRTDILKALLNSRETGNAIGVYSTGLGGGMFITAVDEVYDDDNEQIIVLKRYDLSGLVLQRTNLFLSEIKAICPFEISYRNPVLH